MYLFLRGLLQVQGIHLLTTPTEKWKNIHSNRSLLTAGVLTLFPSRYCWLLLGAHFYIIYFSPDENYCYHSIFCIFTPSLLSSSLLSFSINKSACFIYGGTLVINRSTRGPLFSLHRLETGTPLSWSLSNLLQVCYYKMRGFYPQLF